MKPRGLRNNNPGNLKISQSNWVGKIPKDKNTDGVFEQFEHVKFGVRAMSKLFRNYVKRNREMTLATMIQRYAPSSENNTKSYISAVSKAMNISPDFPAKYWIKSPEKFEDFIKAVIRHENGFLFAVDDDDLKAGIEMSLA